ncbi:MAG: Ig-like domain-containing protein [Planctomycetes bacterium]|nr:Ig-like domain-containing protein [Planctomycetota bacterium]
MGQKAISRSILGLAVIFAVGLGLPACGGGGGGSGGVADTDIYLQKFLVVDRSEGAKSLGGPDSTDVYRDARLLLAFNVPPDMTTVNDRTVRIGIPAGGGLFQNAVGKFVQNVNNPREVFFDPTYTKANPGSTADNPLGFEANAIYQIELLSIYETTLAVRNLSGGGLVSTYRAQIQTIDYYLPTREQPEITGHDPADGATGVPSRADIRIFFTEPMKPSSFVLGQTFIVLDESSGRVPIGQIRFSSDYRTVTFRPLFGYGKGTDSIDPNQAGVPISVLISRGVTNLAGREIPVSLEFSFRTEYDPTQPNFDDRREDFNNAVYEDRSYSGTPNFGDLYPLASWNNASPGNLRGTFTGGQASVFRTTYSTVTLEPWASGAIATQFQTMFFPSEVGGSSRTIRGFEWYKYCTSFSTSCNSVRILMGHTKSGALGTTFAANYSDSPVTCVNGANYVINTGSRVWQAGPTYTTDFPYNGTDNLILEIQHTGSNGGGYTAGVANRGYAEWMEYNGGTALRSVYTPGAGSTAVIGPRVWEYGTRFTYLIDRSEAQSAWYDMGLAQPQFLDYVLNASVPVGTSVGLTFQGAPELPLSAGLPDVDSATDFIGSLSDLSGYRFIRFHAEFKGNGQTNQQAEIDSLIFPFIFFN